MPDETQTALPLANANAPAPSYRRTDQLALAELITWMKANELEVKKMKNTELCAHIHAELPGEQIIDSTIIAMRRRLNMQYVPPAPPEPPKPVDPAIRVLADAVIDLLRITGCTIAPDIAALGTPR
jgi:hypothetical protein